MRTPCLGIFGLIECFAIRVRMSRLGSFQGSQQLRLEGLVVACGCFRVSRGVRLVVARQLDRLALVAGQSSHGNEGKNE